MDKGVSSGNYVNDGSFMERTKIILQEMAKEKGTTVEGARLGKAVSGNLSIGKTIAEPKPTATRKTTQATSGGKIAFSLKQKSKITAPVVKVEDDDEDGEDASNDVPSKRQKLGQQDAAKDSSGQVDVASSLKKGHHMGDYIPQEELVKFMAACNDVAVQNAAKEADRVKRQADNVGHEPLSKMGEGLGSSRRGISDPIMAGNVKKDNLGVGAQQFGEVTPEDDLYNQYKMMLDYRYRPNSLGNCAKHITEG